MLKSLVLISILCFVIQPTPISKYSMEQLPYQSGMVQYINQINCYSSILCIEYDFKIIFLRAFTSSPKLITSFYSLEHQINTGYQKYRGDIKYNVASSLSQITFSTQTDFNANPFLSLYKIRYFVFESSNTNFVLRQVQNDPNAIAISLLQTGFINLTNQSAYVGCFQMHQYSTFAPLQNSFEYSLKCSIASQTSISINITTINIANLNKVVIYVFVAYSKGIFHTDGGQVLLESPTNLQFIQLDLRQNDVFFIAFTQYELPLPTFKIGFDNNDLEILQSSNFIYAKFLFFIVRTKPPLLEISLNLYDVSFTTQNQYQVQNSPIPSFNKILQYSSFSSNTIQSNIITPITNQQIQFLFKASFQSNSYPITYKLKLIFPTSITYNVWNNNVIIILINVPSGIQANNFNTFNSEITIDSFSNSQLSLNLSKNVRTTKYSFSVEHSTIVKTQIQLPLATITKIYTYFQQNYANLVFQNVLGITETELNSNIIKSSNIVSVLFTLFQTTFAATFVFSDVSNDNIIGYKIPIIQTQITFNFELINIKSLLKNQSEKEMKIILSKVPCLHEITVNDFYFDNNGPILKSIEINGNEVTLITDSTNTKQIFNLIFSPQWSSCEQTIMNIPSKIIILQSISLNTETNQITIIFYNVKTITDLDNVQITFGLSNAVLKTKDLVGQKIILTFEYDQILFEKQISIEINLNDNDATQLKTIVPIPSSIDYCINNKTLIERVKVIKTASTVISSLYLAMLLFSIISCRKLYGIQLIQIIQLAFYSLIPINIKCPPFIGLQELKYASGMTSLLTMLPQQYISSNYISLNIYSNFLTNVNILVIPLLIIPFIYFPMKCRANSSEHHHIKPCHQKYGKAMLCELPFTLILFNCYNVFTSFVVNIQAFGTGNLMNLVVSIVCISIFIIAGILFIFFKHHFKEFSSQFDNIFQSRFFDQQKSIKIRKFYPFILLCEMIIIPILLSIEFLFKVGIYIVLAVQILILTFVCIVPLYITRFQNIRNYVHRGIMILICVLQIVTINKKNQYLGVDSIINWQPVILLCFLGLGFLTTGIFTFLKCIQHWKSPNVIDLELKYGRQRPTVPLVDVKPPPGSKYWMPINFYNRKKDPPLGLDHPQNQPRLSHPFKQRIQQWFDQIQTLNLFQTLGVSRNSYFIHKQNHPKLKYSFFRRIFDILKDPGDEIQQQPSLMTITDYLQLIGDELVQKVRFTNANRERNLAIYFKSLSNKDSNNNIKK